MKALQQDRITICYPRIQQPKYHHVFAAITNVLLSYLYAILLPAKMQQFHHCAHNDIDTTISSYYYQVMNDDDVA